MLHLEVVEDVTDEGDVTHPLLYGPLPRLLAAFKLLLQSVQEMMAKRAAVVLLGLHLMTVMHHMPNTSRLQPQCFIRRYSEWNKHGYLDDSEAHASCFFAEHLIPQRLVHDDVTHRLQIHQTWV